jgi:hypothetical protein
LLLLSVALLQGASTPPELLDQLRALQAQMDREHGGDEDVEDWLQQVLRVAEQVAAQVNSNGRVCFAAADAYMLWLAGKAEQCSRLIKLARKVLEQSLLERCAAAV